MAQIEFVGQSARDTDNIAAAPSRLLNCYREPTAEGKKVLKPVLGLAPFSELPAVFVNAMGVVDGRLFIAGASGLYEIETGGAVIPRGDLPNGNSSIAGNNGSVTVCAVGEYWVWDGSVMTQPAPGAFDGFGGLTFFGNYTILTERNGRRFQWSKFADPTDLPGLNFSTADGRDDSLIRPMAVGAMLYLWKETSHEIWYLTGGAGAEALERVAGGVRDIGLKAFGTICTIPGGAFIVGDDNRAHLVSGGAMKPVSTPAVESAIRQGEPLQCVSYEDEGHLFCCVIFADRPAWCFDVATGEWSERAEGLLFDPWTVRASAKWAGEWYAGRADGKLLRFTAGKLDGDVPVIKEAISLTLESDGQRLIVHEVELFPRKGLEGGQITLSTSKDGGLTWGAEKARDIGPPGTMAERVIWRALGQFRRMNVRVRWDGEFAVRADGRVRL